MRTEIMGWDWKDAYKLASSYIAGIRGVHI